MHRNYSNAPCIGKERRGGGGGGSYQCKASNESQTNHSHLHLRMHFNGVPASVLAMVLEYLYI